MADAQSILTPLNIPKGLKADAFDAYQSAKSADDLASRLSKLPLSQSVKADLWDAKNADDTAQAAAAPAPQTQNPTIGEGIERSLASDPIIGTIQGIGSGVLKTGLGAYNLVRKYVPGGDQLPPPNDYAQGLAKTPDSIPGKVGNFIEQAGEFALPAGEAAAATKGAGLLARTAAQALVGGGVSAVQSGGDRAATTTGAILGGAGPIIGAGAEKLAPYVGPAVKRVAAQVLGRTTGAGPAAMQQAIENPTSDLVAAMRGETSEGEVLKNFKDALQQVKDTRAADYQSALSKIPQNISLDPTPVQQHVGYMLGQFGVKQGANGALDFSRSTITDPKAQQQVKSIVKDVADWGSQPGDLTPAGMDTLKRRIGNMFSDDSQASAVIASTRDAAASVLKDNVPGYAEMTKGYETASKFIDALGDLSINSANPGTAIRKLSTVMNQNNGYRQLLTDALSQYSNVDLKGQLAGLNLSKAAPSGTTAAVDASLAAGTGLGVASALHSGVGLLHLVSSGYLGPMAAVSMASASPRLMGELLVAIGKTAPTLKAISASAAPAALPLGSGVANAALTDRGTAIPEVQAPQQ